MIVGFINNSGGDITPVYWTTTGSEPIALRLDSIIGTGTNGFAQGVNTSGVIVGAIAILGNNKPVYWPTTGDAPIVLSLISNVGTGTTGNAFGINTSQVITGSIIISGIQKPMYWPTTGSAPVALSLGAGTEGAGFGINNSNLIVGVIKIGSINTPVYWATTGSAPVALSLASDVGTGTQGDANGINNSGLIVGAIAILGNNKPVYWPTTGDAPIVLRLDSNVGLGTAGQALGINTFGVIVGYIIISGLTTPVYWLSTGGAPVALRLDTGTQGIARGINDSDATSNICFPAGTPIQTDQGFINIEKIDTVKHTINQQTIRHITQTVTLDKYLISFGKSSLGRNIPNQTTIMSKDHQIEFESRLVPAYRFLDFSSDVKKVKYSGEILYNILLDTHGRVNVNGLICETLHPENIIAKLYNNYSEGERYTIISEMNEALGERDALTYKAVVNKVAL